MINLKIKTNGTVRNLTLPFVIAGFHPLRDDKSDGKSKQHVGKIMSAGGKTAYAHGGNKGGKNEDKHRASPLFFVGQPNREHKRQRTVRRVPRREGAGAGEKVRLIPRGEAFQCPGGDKLSQTDSAPNHLERRYGKKNQNGSGECIDSRQKP